MIIDSGSSVNLIQESLVGDTARKKVAEGEQRINTLTGWFHVSDYALVSMKKGPSSEVEIVPCLVVDSKGATFPDGVKLILTQGALSSSF